LPRLLVSWIQPNGSLHQLQGAGPVHWTHRLAGIDGRLRLLAGQDTKNKISSNNKYLFGNPRILPVLQIGVAQGKSY